ncbi:DUF4476 domain-containing protein [Bacteroidales bacterium AH-315-I05]|nr:DUF4476 domain-containing protein [Bacteroidales bacterium AH-315-I05]
MRTFTRFTFFLLCLPLAAGWAGNAFAQNSNVILYTEHGEGIFVILNGIRQNASPETNVKVTGLNANSYRLKVIFEDKVLGEVDKTLYFSEPSTEYTYAVINKNNEYKVRFRTAVELAQAPTHHEHQTVIVYTTTPPPLTSTTTVTETYTTTTEHGHPHTTEGVSMQVNVDGFNMNINVSDDMHSHTTGTSTYSTTTTTTTTASAATSEPDHYVMAGYNGPIGCSWPMADADFSKAKQSAASKDFEDSKLKVAKQITGSNCLMAKHVKEMMRVFDFESSRLEYAKFAYSHTYDKGNYYLVNDAFDFELTIDDLNDYIGQ